MWNGGEFEIATLQRHVLILGYAKLEGGSRGDHELLSMDKIKETRLTLARKYQNKSLPTLHFHHHIYIRIRTPTSNSFHGLVVVEAPGCLRTLSRIKITESPGSRGGERGRVLE